MANIIGPRLRMFRDSLGLTQGEFGDKCSISQRTYANLENGKTQKVSSDYLNHIERAFPELNPKWLRLGIGSMLREAAAPEPTPSVEEPAAPYARPAAAPDAVYKLLDLINQKDREHHAALKEQREDHREQMRGMSERWQHALDLTARQLQEKRDELLALEERKDEEIARLQYEIHALKLRAGLRLPTPEEEEVAEKAEAARKEREKKKPAGFELQSMRAVHSYSEPAFIRPQEAKVFQLHPEEELERAAA